MKHLCVLYLILLSAIFTGCQSPCKVCGWTPKRKPTIKIVDVQIGDKWYRFKNIGGNKYLMEEFPR